MARSLEEVKVVLPHVLKRNPVLVRRKLLRSSTLVSVLVLASSGAIGDIRRVFVSGTLAERP
jgi:hypothetical protein